MFTCGPMTTANICYCYRLFEAFPHNTHREREIQIVEKLSNVSATLK